MHGHILPDAVLRAIPKWLMSFARIIRVVWIAEPPFWCESVWVPKVRRGMVCSILVNRDARILWDPSAEDRLPTPWDDSWNANRDRWV